MRLQILQHVDFEGAGRIAAWASERQCRLATTHLYRNELLPKCEDFDGLVIMGGPMNVYQTDKFPWLREEKTFISDFVASGKPVLGICLGAQLLAEALGGRVFAHRYKEIGWAPVEFTSEARQRFPNLPASRSVLHWHGDTYEMPRGARRFAQSKWCSEQGFLWGSNVLAMQFHLEVGAVECNLFLEHGKADLERPESAVQSAEEIIEGATNGSKVAEETLYLILDQFFAPLLAR